MKGGTWARRTLQRQLWRQARAIHVHIYYDMALSRGVETAYSLEAGGVVRLIPGLAERGFDGEDDHMRYRLSGFPWNGIVAHVKAHRSRPTLCDVACLNTHHVAKQPCMTRIDVEIEPETRVMCCYRMTADTLDRELSTGM